MLYLLAIVLPPLALLFAGAPVQALLNLLLFVLSIVLAIFTFGTLWMICIAWALVAVHGYYSEQRVRRAVADAVRTNAHR